MPDLKYLYRVLYIASLNKLLIIFFNSFHLKDLEISKYKRESKGRWPIKICRFIFVNCCLIWLSKHFTWVLMRKKKPVISNTGKFFCFNNNVSNLYNNSVVAKIFTLLMFRKPNMTTINKNNTTHFYQSTSLRFSFIFRYFKVFQVKRIVYIVISNTGRFFCFNSTVSYT
jgi:hypothetical protein